MRSRSVRRGIVALGVAFTTLCVTGVLSYREWTQRQRMLAEADQTRRVLSLSEALLADLRDAETGQRGYLLTGRLNYLEPYNSAVAHIPPERSELSALAVRDPELLLLLAQLEAAID